jgi:hypothetical protein
MTQYETDSTTSLIFNYLLVIFSLGLGVYCVHHYHNIIL